MKLTKEFLQTIEDLEQRGKLEYFGRNGDYFVYNFRDNETYKLYHLAIYDDGRIEELK